MAVVFEGFSIREYAAKMRAVDVVKCWPFAGGSRDDESEIKKEQVEALLPPITVTKFRWWSNELNKNDDKEESPQSVVGEQQQQQQQLCLDRVARNGGEEEGEHEEEKLEMMVCPVCGNFGSTTVNAVNAHIDSCLSQAGREERRKMRMVAMKAKSKPTKKRSILEIFAVSPLVHKVDNDDDNDDDDDDEEDDFDEDVHGFDVARENQLKQEKVKKIHKKIKKVAILNKLTMDKKKKKKTKKKKLKDKKKKKKKMKKIKKSNDKDYMHGPKLPTSVSSSGKVSGPVCNKGLGKDLKDENSTDRKKHGLKSSTDKRTRVKTSKLISKHKKPEIQVRGILKKRVKFISGHKVGDKQDRSQCGVQQDRHVRFSGKDDILGPRIERLSTAEHSICDRYPSVCDHHLEQDQSAGSDRELAAMEVTECADDVHVITGDQTGLPPITNQNQQSDFSGLTDDRMEFIRPQVTREEMEQHISDASLTKNQVSLCNNTFHMFDKGCRIGSQNPTYAGILRLLPMVSGSRHPCVNSQFSGGGPRDSNSQREFIDSFGDRAPGVAGPRSVACTASLPQSAPLDFASTESADERVSFMPQSAVRGIGGHGFQYQPHLSPVELTGPKWRQGSAAFQERCMDQEFSGLPLNSRGELVPASSSGRCGFNQIKQATATSSSSTLSMRNVASPRYMEGCVSEKNPIERAAPKDQLELFPVWKSPNVHLPARLGVTDLPNTGRIDGHSFKSEKKSNGSHFDSDMNLLNIPFSRCQPYDSIQNNKADQPMSVKENLENMVLKARQPTMRLMGKDVVIGRSNIEMKGLDDEKIWTDKEIIQEHRTISTAAIGNSSLKRPIQRDRILQPDVGRYMESSPNSSEVQGNRASLGNFMIKSPECHPFFNHKTDAVFRNSDIAGSGRDDISFLHNLAYENHPPMLPYKAAYFQEPFMSVGETASSSRLPLLSSAHRGPHIGWRPMEINYQHDLAPATRPAPNFPFLQPTFSEHVQPSPFPCSSNNRPPWLLHATIQVKAASDRAQTLSDMAGENPNVTTRSNFLAASTLQQLSVASYPCNPTSSNQQLKNSLGPALVCPPVIQRSPDSSITSGHTNRIKGRERIKFKASGAEVPDHCQKTKKRSATKADDLMRPRKMSRLRQEDLSAVEESRRQNCSGETNKICLIRHEAIVQGCGPEAEKDGLRTSRGIGSSKLDGPAKSGPVKLSAGAKHIFTPGQNKDPRLVHSAIPSASVTAGCVSLSSSQKPSKIYRF